MNRSMTFFILTLLLFMTSVICNESLSHSIFKMNDLIQDATPTSAFSEPEKSKESKYKLDSSSSKKALNWPAFRGQGNGISLAHHLPKTEAETKEPQWRSDIEGYGQSSPIIWNEKIFITSVSGNMQNMLIISCYDIKEGNLNWKKTFPTSQKIKNDFYHSRAPGTPIATESKVISFFASGDLIALDHDGELIWKRSLTQEFGEIQGNHGLGTSPILGSSQDHFYLLVDHEGPSYFLKLETKSGKTIWKQDRSPRVSWATPYLYKNKNSDLIVVSSSGLLDVYESKKGHKIWFSNMDGNTVASPFSHESSLVIPSKENDFFRCLPTEKLATYSGNQKILSKGIFPETATTSFGSPIIYQQKLYSTSRSGSLYCNNLNDGKLIWKLRMPSSCWASPIATAQHIYFFCNEGEVLIIPSETDQTPPEPKTFKLDISKKEKEKVYGAATVEKNLIIRSGNKLFCYRAT